MPLPVLPAALPVAVYMLAALGTCAPTSAPRLDLTLKVEKPSWSYKKTSDELKRDLPPVSKLFPIVSGYTQTVTRDRYHIDFYHLKNRATGLQCVWPETVTVTVSYAADIFIAKNYPKGGCRDLQTRAHELGHVAIDVQLLNEALPALRARAERAMNKKTFAGPATEADAAAIRAAVLERVKNAVHGELQRVEGLRNKRHAKIDSAEEYTRMARACGR